jgi:hypothetical protein
MCACTNTTTPTTTHAPTTRQQLLPSVPSSLFLRNSVGPKRQRARRRDSRLWRAHPAAGRRASPLASSRLHSQQHACSLPSLQQQPPRCVVVSLCRFFVIRWLAAAVLVCWHWSRALVGVRLASQARCHESCRRHSCFRGRCLVHRHGSLASGQKRLVAAPVCLCLHQTPARDKQRLCSIEYICTMVHTCTCTRVLVPCTIDLPYVYKYVSI